MIKFVTKISWEQFINSRHKLHEKTKTGLPPPPPPPPPPPHKTNKKNTTPFLGNNNIQKKNK